MTLGPAPDWQHISWMVGNYNGEPILVTVDGLGNLTTGLGAYSDRYVFRKSGTGTGADLTIETGVVPADERWVITNINAWHLDTTPRVVEVSLHAPAYYYYLFSNRFLLYCEFLSRQGEWILKEGDSIAATFTTLGSAKVAYLNVTGYKIKVA